MAMMSTMPGYCNPTISCSGFGTCDPISAACICDNDHFSSDCSGVCSDHCYAEGTEFCSLATGASTPTCTCKPSYWDTDCRWSCTCTTAGTLSCNDGSSGDGSCLCKSGFIGFACDSCAAYMYPPGECFRRCEEGVDCLEGTCTPFTGICECQTGWEGTNCGCNVDMSPGDSCGGQGFCADNGACICDVRVQGSQCADSKSYQLAETNCPYCNNVGICVEDAGQFACSCAKKLGYYGTNCEVFCSSCNPLNTRTCAILNQVETCDCEDWWWGADCSRPCPCILAGSKSCLASTGQCECKEGWAGIYCEQCAPGYYPEGACDVQCDFGTTCHLNGICGPSGSCLCNDLWEGEGCTYCTFDGLPEVGDNTTSYPYPPCSTRCSDSTTCNGHGRCTDVGLCECDRGWYGGPVVCWDQVLASQNGWHRTADIPDCNIQMPLGAGFRSECSLRCTCSYPGTHFCREGRTGDGLCVCHSGWGGLDCERCDEGYFPAPETAAPSCTTLCVSSVTCSGHGECNDFGTCDCDSGWAGRNCDHCAENWFPLGSCDVYCTMQETCSYHGRCSPQGLCLRDDGWMTGSRSPYQYALDELNLEDFFPGGNASFGDEQLWRCLVSCSSRYGLDSEETDLCIQQCVRQKRGHLPVMQSAVFKTHYGIDGLRTNVEEPTSFMSMKAGAGLGAAAGGGIKGAGILGGTLSALNPLTLLSKKDEKEEKDASKDPDPNNKMFKQVNYIEKEICNMNCKVAALMGAAAGAAAGGMAAKAQGGGSPMGAMAGPLDETNAVPFFVLTKQLEDMQSQVDNAVDRVRSLSPQSPVGQARESETRETQQAMQATQATQASSVDFI